MSLPVIVWVFKHSDATLGARLVLLVLAEFAHDDGTDAFPEVETIAARARMSRKGVQDALRRLERDGLIERTGTRSSGTRVYRILGLGGEETTPRGEDDDLAGAKMTDSRGEVTTPDPSRPNNEDPSVKESVSVLSREWLGRRSLMAHRPAYFETAAVETAVKRARKVYPVEAIAEAISNYATVLAGADYRWSHRWTFIDFLGRGLDKFVAEADPLRNFRSSRQTPTREDFGDLADL